MTRKRCFYSMDTSVAVSLLRSRFAAVNAMGRLLVWLVTAVLLCPALAEADKEIPQFCQWQTFNATCGPNEVIVMQHAQYGRMRLGQCLTTDVYIGCGADVLSQLDAKCSGRQACHVDVPDATLHDIQPCPQDMMAYLEASYTCVKVGNLPEGRQCTASLPDTSSYPLTNLTGALSSRMAHATGYGKLGCPWRVQVRRGQNIRVSLLDFGLAARYQSEGWETYQGGGESEREYCYVYAMIREEAKEFTVCARTERETPVYVSTSNVVEISLLDGEDSTQNFLLTYEAVGCPDLVAPNNAHALREGEKATITCNDTTQAWHLVCKGTEWVGEYGECSAGVAVPEDDNVPSYGLILAILIGVAIGVMVGFTLLAGVLYCRRRRHEQVPQEAPDLGDRMTTLPMTTSTPGTPSCKVHRLKGEYGYTHVWEVQRSPGGTTYRPAGTHTPDSAYQSYQSHRGGGGGGGVAPQIVGDTMVCFHTSKKDHEYESPKFETFGVGVGRHGEPVFPRPMYPTCGKATCTLKPQAKGAPSTTTTAPTPRHDSMDSVVHIEVGMDSPPLRAGPGGPSQTAANTCYSMAGDTKGPGPDMVSGPMPDIGLDPRVNHYT